MNDQVHATDVLVLGGGFAGTWAAIRAAEMGASVTLVEKATVARGGASTLSSGVTTGPRSEDDLDAWVIELLERGDYMCDPTWTRTLLEGQVERINDLRRWGVPFVTDESGEVKQYLSRGMVVVRGAQYPPKRAMEVLRARMDGLGVRVINRQAVIDLLTSDDRHPTRGRVCGATCLDVRTADVHIHQAKTVILATGPASLKGYQPVDNNTGDGLALALRAGADIADLEFAFSGTFNIVAKQYRVLSLFNIGLGHGLRLINRHGHQFMADHDPERLDRGEVPVVVAAFVAELIQGRGPIYMDLTACDEDFWHNMDKQRGELNSAILFSGAIPNPKETPIQIEATRGFWSNGRIGPLIDHAAATSVPGLYAAGAVAKNVAVGTHGSAGIPTAFAMTSGYVAGENAALEALGTKPPRELAPTFVRQLGITARRPLTREPTGFGTNAALSHLVSLQGTVLDNFTLTDKTIEKRLSMHESMIERVRCIDAEDPHDLIKAHEAANAHYWLGCSLKAMRMRTESRGGMIVRLDYPLTDDRAWRCWHAARADDHNKLSFRKIDFPSGEFVPEFREPYPDPAAGIIGEAMASRTEQPR